MLKKTIKTILYSLIITLSLYQTAFAEIVEVNFAYVGEVDHSALPGARQGLEESNLQGQFLNQKYNLDIVSAKDSQTHDFSAYIAVFTTVDADTFKNLATKLPDTPVFNLSLNDDVLRTACFNNALHIIPSDRMVADAIAQWQQKEPDSKASAQAWHPDFVKFAARDLNKRFTITHNTAMNDYSWAGWVAVKMTADSVARTQITEPAKMLNYLKTDLAFDGQKGDTMNFRETGQLRQPLLLVEDDKIVAEAPVRGIAKPPTLDSLGTLDCAK
jgi:hypothetical protein